jgi:acetamidase/formamidase
VSDTLESRLDDGLTLIGAHHDRWDGSLVAAHDIASGEMARLEATVAGRRFKRKRDVESAVRGGGPDGDRMALAGPIGIVGARPGDAVRIDVVEVTTDAWGYTRVQPGFGLLGDEITHDTLVIWDLRDGSRALPVAGALADRGVTVPTRPFPGVIGCAPAGPPRGTRAPGQHGGNLDVRKLVAGATVWLPVAVDGALLSMGDLHAAQGSGEVGGTAIETSGEVTVRVSVEPDRHLDGPLFMTPTPHPDGLVEAFCATGIGPDLMAAARDAVRVLTSYVAQVLDIDTGLAYALVSVVADLAIEEIVDRPDWVVSCCLPESVLAAGRRPGT